MDGLGRHEGLGGAVIVETTLAILVKLQCRSKVTDFEDVTWNGIARFLTRFIE